MKYFTVVLFFALSISACGNSSRESSGVEESLATGILAEDVTTSALLDASIREITAAETVLINAKKTLFNLNSDGLAKKDGASFTAISWDPTHDAALLESTPGLNTPLLLTNAVTNSNYTAVEKELVVIGEIGTTPYMVMGSNPFRGRGSLNADMNSLMLNTFKWLTRRDDLTRDPLKIVLSQLAESYYFKDQSGTRNWIKTQIGEHADYNRAGDCNGLALSECLTGADLLIISQVSVDEKEAELVSDIVEKAILSGLPVLYLHHDGDLKPLGKRLFSDVFRVSYSGDNYWRRLALSDFNPQPKLRVIPETFRSIRKTLESVDSGNLNYDWSQCSGENCSQVTGFKDDFLPGARAARALLRKVDGENKPIFNYEGYRIHRLLVLLGDKLRQQVVYPLDKEDGGFLRAYLADHLVYNLRAVNPAAPDLGNFSRTNFSSITPVSKLVSLTSRQHFRSAGVYALPGQPVRVTRTDNSEVDVTVFINSVRDGATHEFAPKGYKRPKFLKSAAVPLQTGETVTITSPYGGPVQLGFSENNHQVTVQFDNVGEHPHWRTRADDASFAERLSKAEYDWAEIATHGFEVHSKIEKMQRSVSDVKWGRADALASATEQYMHNYPHVLAGFAGDGIDVVDEVQSFATLHGLTIETLDIVKHMNADQAACGNGCSGNPYDAYWDFDPVFHGDVHELGHGLEKARLRFQGWEVHASTNPYSYYTKSRYNQNTGGDPSCQNLRFKEVFNHLQASQKTSDPKAYLKNNLWDASSWNEQFIVTLQAMMHAQKEERLVNGWHLLPRLHILDREVSRVKADWETRKASIGFSSYTLEEFNKIPANDWLLVSLSFASGLDYRGFLDMMGIPYSQVAADQVAAFSYPAVPKTYFVSSPDGYCKTDSYGAYLDKITLPIDGSSVWPE